MATPTLEEWTRSGMEKGVAPLGKGCTYFDIISANDLTIELNHTYTDVTR